MGKTGTTNNFPDALFVGSAYGPEGVTVAARIGFDDNRSLGAKETGGRVALPVIQRNHAQRVRQEAGRARAGVPTGNGTEDQRLSGFWAGRNTHGGKCFSPGNVLNLILKIE
jgi:membrane carboxypeptidase/penicillin-binding protein